MTIKDEIKRAQEKVAKARKDYDAAVEELSRLMDKHNHQDIRAWVTPAFLPYMILYHLHMADA